MSLSLIAPAVSTATDDNTQPPYFWTCGNQSGVFMVLKKQIKNHHGFQIFYRKTVSTEFTAGNFYTGTPKNTAIINNRLQLFLPDGLCQSYDLAATRTEQRIPENQRLISCVGRNNTLYALVISNDNEITVNSKSKDNQWQPVVSDPLPITDWNPEKTNISVPDNTIFLFGIKNAEVFYCQLTDAKWSAPKQIPIDNVIELKALTVNRQIRLIASVITETQQEAQFYIARPTDTGWTFSDEPLRKNPQTILAAPPDKISFAAFGQNIAAFRWTSNKEILFGQYDQAGKILKNLDQPILAVQLRQPAILRWLLGPESITIMFVIMTILLYIYRKDAFGNLSPLPEYIRLAPLLTRLLAAVIDGSMIIFVSQIIFYFILGDLTTEQLQTLSSTKIIAEQLTMGTLSPEILNILMIITLTSFATTLLYFTFFEIMFAATIGKFVMNLAVLNADGSKISPSQAVMRNLVRVLEFYPVLLFTRRRQRIGDLIAKTIVVAKTPELIKKMQSQQEKQAGNIFDKYDEE